MEENKDEIDIDIVNLNCDQQIEEKEEEEKIELNDIVDIRTEQTEDGPILDLVFAKEDANSIDQQLLADIRKNKYIAKGHGLNPDNLKIGDERSAAFLKSLLP